MEQGSTIIKQTRQIVIVTEEFDPHADIMLLKLRELGHNPIRLHTADFPQRSRLSYHCDGSSVGGFIQVRDQRVDLEQIGTIWWRRPAPYKLPSGLTKQERAFAQMEQDHALNGIWYMLDCYWMSFPPNIRIATHKPGQLKRAAELGFEVPRTLITSDPDQVRAFYDRCDGKIIYKVLSDPMLAYDKIVPREPILLAPGEKPTPVRTTYTTPIRELHFADLESVRSVPCQFQEYVPKRVELRVTVIGDDVFAAEIHSQAHERTTYDWRHYDVTIPIRRADLPLDVAERCYAFTKSYGLNFSTLDLILTPDGRYVFLENNPNGQWMWVQEHVPELKMIEAMAACLINGKATMRDQQECVCH